MPTPPTTAADGEIRKPPIREILQGRIMRLEEKKFRIWLAKQGWQVRHQQVAKTMLSTFIEEWARVLNGVWFHNPELVCIGVTRETVIKMKVPAWMTDYINSYPRAEWPEV